MPLLFIELELVKSNYFAIIDRECQKPEYEFNRITDMSFLFFMWQGLKFFD